MEGLLHFLRPLALTVRDVLPIAAVIVGFQLFVIRKPIARFFAALWKRTSRFLKKFHIANRIESV